MALSLDHGSLSQVLAYGYTVEVITFIDSDLAFLGALLNISSWRRQDDLVVRFMVDGLIVRIMSH